MTETKYLKGIVDAEDALSFLIDRINRQEYKGSDYLWGGADGVIGASPAPKSKGWWSNNDISIVKKIRGGQIQPNSHGRRVPGFPLGFLGIFWEFFRDVLRIFKGFFGPIFGIGKNLCQKNMG